MNKVGKFYLLPAQFGTEDFGIVYDKDLNPLGLLFDEGIQHFLWSDEGTKLREKIGEEGHLEGADDFVMFGDIISTFTLFDVLPRHVRLCVHEGFLSVICDASDISSFPLFAEAVRLFGGNIIGEDTLYKEWFDYWFHDQTDEDVSPLIKSTSPINSGFSGRMSRVIGDM